MSGLHHFITSSSSGCCKVSSHMTGSNLVWGLLWLNHAKSKEQQYESDIQYRCTKFSHKDHLLQYNTVCALMNAAAVCAGYSLKAHILYPFPMIKDHLVYILTIWSSYSKPLQIKSCSQVIALVWTWIMSSSTKKTFMNGLSFV